MAVKDLKIQPSQAWELDFVELHVLINQDNSTDDLSVMLNFERVMNGADKKWLHNL